MMRCFTPTKRQIIKPKGGWEPHTWYLIDVSYASGNPIHRALLYTGFLEHGKPAGYSGITSASYIERNEVKDAFYIKCLKRLYQQNEE